MRVCWLLSAAAALALSVAAVWFGSLNQDEGWYLYAAQLVGSGGMPYRDFAFTQGPMMPIVYSALSWSWKTWGLLGARIVTLCIALSGLAFCVALVRRIARDGGGSFAALAVFLLLGCNLYHLYYSAIPKTYALASLFVAIGFYLLSSAEERKRYLLPAAFALAFAAGTRLSLGIVLAVVVFYYLFRRRWIHAAVFASSAAFALLLVYGPFLLDEGAREGFLYAQKYHAARGGSDIVWTVGSLSRLVRWYLPVFVLLGLGHAVKVSPFARLVGFSFAAVFALQMCAPFPYEDYQVPVMQLLATYAAVKFSGLPDGQGIAVRRRTLLVFALAFACAFGNPLLEKWTTNGQDRFWTRKKAKSELAQLREVARFIESVDPGGKDLLTQDLYLAVESGRSVPKGLEMGPFSDLKDEEWTRLLSGAPCRIAALSGYSFAIEPPVCNERPVEKQMEFWEVLKKNYRLVGREEFFGQNSTTLLILERNEKK